MQKPSSRKTSFTDGRSSSQIRARHDRAGIVGFLEFAGTLPVFAMLFLSAAALHQYYKHTRQAYAEAHLAVCISFDKHMSAKLPPDLLIARSGRLPRPDKLTATNAPLVNHIFVNYFQAVSSRKPKGNISWLGKGVAVGFSYGNRDSWAHFDFEAKMKNGEIQLNGSNWGNLVEAMPFVLISPQANGALAKAFLRI